MWNLSTRRLFIRWVAPSIHDLFSNWTLRRKIFVLGYTHGKRSGFSLIRNKMAAHTHELLSFVFQVEAILWQVGRAQHQYQPNQAIKQQMWLTERGMFGVLCLWQRLFSSSFLIFQPYSFLLKTDVYADAAPICLLTYQWLTYVSERSLYLLVYFVVATLINCGA